jgi:two-component system KDP operon response regulator KdpE
MTSPRPPKILVVDDEPQIRRFLRASLPQQGYALVEAATGAEAQAQFAREKPDIVILDLGLPDCDGLDVLAQIRKQSLTPVLVLSAREDVAGKVAALEAGADDYVTKPFDMAELVARLKAALRHGIQAVGEEPVFRAGTLMLDLVHRKVEVSGQEVKLTPKEYDVLRFLARHAGKVATHHQLLREVWGPAHAEDVQYLRVLMRQLRQKIEAEPSNPRILLTESGVGYRLAISG